MYTLLDEHLFKLFACIEARDYVNRMQTGLRPFDDFVVLWKSCIRGEWLVWYAVAMGCDPELVSAVLADCILAVVGMEELRATDIGSTVVCALRNKDMNGLERILDSIDWKTLPIDTRIYLQPVDELLEYRKQPIPNYTTVLLSSLAEIARARYATIDDKGLFVSLLATLVIQARKELVAEVFERTRKALKALARMRPKF